MLTLDRRHFCKSKLLPDVVSQAVGLDPPLKHEEGVAVQRENAKTHNIVTDLVIPSVPLAIPLATAVLNLVERYLVFTR